jgi:pSer/pThr/pTyr-binding forkhead associated (FHA) protein
MNKPKWLPCLIDSDGQEIVISDQVILGRLPECTVQIEDSRISRQHARIEIKDDRLIITDLGSHNGTWVNEQKIIGPTELKNGDRIRLGQKIFTFKERSSNPNSDETGGIPERIIEGGTTSWKIPEPMTLVRGDGAEFGLSQNTTIGRDKSNSIVLAKDTSASQFNSKIEIQDTQIFICDINSRNGTWVNDKRIAQPTLIRHGDRLRVGDTIFRLRIGNRPLPPLSTPIQSSRVGRNSVKVSASVALGVTMAVILCVGIAATAIWYVPKILASPTPQASPTKDPESVAATQQAEEIHSALHAVVNVMVISNNFYCYAYDETNKLVRVRCAGGGSGSVINEQGYILTNFHVLGNALTNEVDWKDGTTKGDLYDSHELIVVGMNPTNPEEPPNTFYQCEIVAADPDMDLAILHIAAVASPDDDPFSAFQQSQWTMNPLPENTVFNFLPIGNSDLLSMGDPITIIGFPGIGGNTVTQTSGIVAGFLPDSDLNLDKGWIKTDAEVNRGNSGGMAINIHGELIGVPTLSSLTTGGNIGYIRPINSAYEFRLSRF